MKIKIILLVFFLPLSLLAQVGGITAFSFVDVGLPPIASILGESSTSTNEKAVIPPTWATRIEGKQNTNKIIFIFIELMW